MTNKRSRSIVITENIQTFLIIPSSTSLSIHSAILHVSQKHMTHASCAYPQKIEN